MRSYTCQIFSADDSLFFLFVDAPDLMLSIQPWMDSCIRSRRSCVRCSAYNTKMRQRRRRERIERYYLDVDLSHLAE